MARAVEVGLRGLETLRKYTSLDARASSWKLDLEQDPLGEAAFQTRRAEGLAAAAAADREARKKLPAAAAARQAVAGGAALR